MKKNYEERAMDFIKILHPYIRNVHTYERYKNAWGNFSSDHPRRKVLFMHGVSRVAFITSDYVIKCDYKHEKCWNWAGDCEREVLNYLEAESEGFGYLFAKITHVTYGGRDYYIMPRISSIGKHLDIGRLLTLEEYDYVCSRYSDIHYGNFGMKDGRPVIVDYAERY